MNVDSKLTIILSATSLTVSLVLGATIVLLVVLLYAHKRSFKAKESKSAKIELTKMEELTMHVNPTSTFNTYTSEEKDDLM